MMSTELTDNTAERLVPTEINGHPATGFRGVGKYEPTGRKTAPPIRTCADYPADGNKVVADIKIALENAGLRDGMTVSSHHHFRNGDKSSRSGRARRLKPMVAGMVKVGESRAR